MKPGVSVEESASEAVVLGKRVYEAYPMRNQAGSGSASQWSANARPLGATRVAPAVRRSLLVLFGAVGCVLLIACANLANLLLARASARQREIAVRLAIGAGRARLVRLLLTESLLLASLGGAVSVAVAWWGTRALSAVNPQAALQVQGLAGLGIVTFSSIHIDAAALAFTLLVALTVGVLFGLVPALQATRGRLDLRSGTAPAPRVGGVRGVGTRRALVVSEVALAVVLLAGAGLMLRNPMHVDPGFDWSNLLTVRLTISPGQVPRDSMPGFYDGLLACLRGIAGVAGAAIGDCPPLNGGCNGTIITFPDRPAPPRGSEPGIGVHVVTPGWFRTMHVPLKRGRLFTDEARIGTPHVSVISESAARKYWPNEDPLGTCAGVWQGGFQDGATVVGVVGDVRYGTIDSLPGPDVYISYGQSPRPRMIFLRTAGDPEAVAGPARAAIHALSPNYPAFDTRSMASRVVAASAQARLSAVLLALFAAVALALAVVGVYGVLSFAVTQRTREIGIRMALGAEPAQVIRLFLREGIALAFAGAALGLAAALQLSRVLRSLLFGVDPADPTTYAAIAGVLGIATFVAGWVPARRAARVDPNVALRYD